MLKIIAVFQMHYRISYKMEVQGVFPKPEYKAKEMKE